MVDDDEHISQANAMWLDMPGTSSQVLDSGESVFKALRASIPNNVVV